MLEQFLLVLLLYTNTSISHYEPKVDGNCDKVFLVETRILVAAFFIFFSIDSYGTILTFLKFLAFRVLACLEVVLQYVLVWNATGIRFRLNLTLAFFYDTRTSLCWILDIG